MSQFSSALERFEARTDPQAAAREVFATLDYVPTPRQQEFHDATEFAVLYGGAVGGGKTKALLMDCLLACVEHPGIRVGAFRRTFAELKESLIAELAQVGFAKDLGATWNASDFDLKFANGSIIMFRYAETLTDATRRQGGAYQLLAFDERTLTPPEVCTFLESRLRSARTDVPVIGVRSASNPGDIGHAAVKSEYIDSTGYGERIHVDGRGRTVRFIPAKLSDNPHLNPEYADDLKGLPEDLRRAFLEGNWDIFRGQVFTEWDRDRHLVPGDNIDLTAFTKYAGVDWGFANPWAVVWGAVDEDDRIWIYDELYDTQVGESDQAKRILASEGGDRVLARYADDAMWTQRGDAKPIAEVYSEHGCHLDRAHKGERINGWMRMHSYLSDGPACPHHRAMGWETCPRLHVLEGAAPNLVRTLPALAYDTRLGRAEDVNSRAEDHAPDALRYLLINLGESVLAGMTQPAPTEPDLEPSAPHTSPWSLDTYFAARGEDMPWGSSTDFFDAT